MDLDSDFEIRLLQNGAATQLILTHLDFWEIGNWRASVLIGKVLRDELGVGLGLGLGQDISLSFGNPIKASSIYYV